MLLEIIYEDAHGTHRIGEFHHHVMEILRRRRVPSEQGSIGIGDGLMQRRNRLGTLGQQFGIDAAEQRVCLFQRLIQRAEHILESSRHGYQALLRTMEFTWSEIHHGA